MRAGTTNRNPVPVREASLDADGATMTKVPRAGSRLPAILDQAIEAARTFKPMSDSDMASLLARTKDAAMTGKFEPFKTTQQFDSTASNPKWLGGTPS